MNDDGYFEAVEIPAEPNPTPADELMPVASQVDNKDRARSKDITYDDDGFPVFPTNEKGLPVLPRNEKDQPIFPLDPNGKPVFPYDRKTGLWSFPVDDCEDPIFPRTEEGNPIVPQDQNGKSKETRNFTQTSPLTLTNNVRFRQSDFSKGQFRRVHLSG